MQEMKTKRVGVDYIQILVAAFLFSTLFVFMAVTIQGFGNMVEEHPLDLYAQIMIQFWIYAAIPFCVYIAVFTKFNNPFRKMTVGKECDA